MLLILKGFIGFLAMGVHGQKGPARHKRYGVPAIKSEMSAGGFQEKLIAARRSLSTSLISMVSMYSSLPFPVSLAAAPQAGQERETPCLSDWAPHPGQ
jgi:hypothetical protein